MEQREARKRAFLQRAEGKYGKWVEQLRQEEFKRLEGGYLIFFLLFHSCFCLQLSSMKGMTYLDHAGASLYAATQMKKVFDDLSGSVYGNPRS
jgi:hypothetical protein